MTVALPQSAPLVNKLGATVQDWNRKCGFVAIRPLSAAWPHRRHIETSVLLRRQSSRLQVCCRQQIQQ